MHTILYQHGCEEWEEPFPFPCHRNEQASKNTEEAVPQGYEGRNLKGAINMNFDTFIAIVCLVGAVVSYIGYRISGKTNLKYQKGVLR